MNKKVVDDHQKKKFYVSLAILMLNILTGIFIFDYYHYGNKIPSFFYFIIGTSLILSIICLEIYYLISEFKKR